MAFALTALALTVYFKVIYEGVLKTKPLEDKKFVHIFSNT